MIHGLECLLILLLLIHICLSHGIFELRPLKDRVCDSKIYSSAWTGVLTLLCICPRLLPAVPPYLELHQGAQLFIIQGPFDSGLRPRVWDHLRILEVLLARELFQLTSLLVFWLEIRVDLDCLDMIPLLLQLLKPSYDSWMELLEEIVLESLFILDQT